MVYTIELPLACIVDCSRPGPVDAECSYWAQELADKFAAVPAEVIRRELAEYGGWDEEELEDDKANIARILFCLTPYLRHVGDDGAIYIGLEG